MDHCTDSGDGTTRGMLPRLIMEDIVVTSEKVFAYCTPITFPRRRAAYFLIPSPIAVIRQID